MGAIFLLAGMYLLAVAFQGNGSALIDQLKKEKHFFSWAIAIVILKFLYDNKTTRPFAGPMIGLTILAYLISNKNTIFANFANLMQKLKG